MKNPIRVRDVMQTDFDCIDGLTTIRDAIDGMKHWGNQCLIISRRDDNDEIGLLHLADIARHVLAQGRAPERISAYEIMQKPVVSVQPGMDIRYCVRLLDRLQLPRVPVVDGGEVVGIVGNADLVRKGLAAGVDQL